MAITLPGQTLRGVAAKLRQLSYVPTSWQGVLAGLNADGRSQLDNFLHDLVHEGATPQLMAMVLEHLADQREALQRERDAWSFVWSGPEPAHAKTADTFATVDQLIQQAQTSLLIATYNIGLSSQFQELLESIAHRLESGLLQRVEIFFHPIQIADRLGSDPLNTVQQWFDKEVWPWPAKPLAYVDRRLLSASAERCYQHAKVVVTDAGLERSSALVTSANFSETAQRHNFEAGWLVREPWRADQVARHFHQMVADGLFVEIRQPSN